LTIYYDRSCPLCAHEMHTLLAHDRRGALRLIDSSAPEFFDADAAAAGISAAQMSTLIHARDAGGRWYIGVDVFVLAYRAAGLTWIARIWSQPRLRPLWDRLYPWVARHRMTLSRFGLARGYGWLVDVAARRAARRSRACVDTGCG
jgi:predicted DCC family thiol-disulfide oxidoreductase YuxK